jgi:predicted metal-dependent phosphoesterase TrpH
MIKLDMHVHTYYSVDGLNSPRELLLAAKEKGLDGLAITDHNSLNAIKNALKVGKELNMIVIPGCEINTKEGHLLAYWPKDKVPDKPPKKDKPAKEIIKELKKQGAIIAIPHPFSSLAKLYKILRGKSLFFDKETFQVLDKIDAIEIYNNHSPFKKACKVAKENKIPMFGGSDSHMTRDLGKIYTQFPGDFFKNYKRAKPVYTKDLKYSLCNLPFGDILLTFYFKLPRLIGTLRKTIK